MEDNERIAQLETSLSDHIKLCNVLRNQNRFLMGLVLTGYLALGGWVWHLHEVSEERILTLTRAVYSAVGNLR